MTLVSVEFPNVWKAVMSLGALSTAFWTHLVPSISVAPSSPDSSNSTHDECIAKMAEDQVENVEKEAGHITKDEYDAMEENVLEDEDPYKG